jgi:DNA-binding LytR/AlgR family response regulator
VEYSLVKIIVDDINYIEGYKDYIKIHLASSSKPVITRMSLKAIEEKLPASKFVRTHKSYIAAIPRITSIKRDFVCINQTEIPVSESYKGVLEKITGSSQQ